MIPPKANFFDFPSAVQTVTSSNLSIVSQICICQKNYMEKISDLLHSSTVTSAGIEHLSVCWDTKLYIKIPKP